MLLPRWPVLVDNTILKFHLFKQSIAFYKMFDSIPVHIFSNNISMFISQVKQNCWSIWSVVFVADQASKNESFMFRKMSIKLVFRPVKGSSRSGLLWGLGIWVWCKNEPFAWILRHIGHIWNPWCQNEFSDVFRSGFYFHIDKDSTDIHQGRCYGSADVFPI